MNTRPERWIPGMDHFSDQSPPELREVEARLAVWARRQPVLPGLADRVFDATVGLLPARPVRSARAMQELFRVAEKTVVVSVPSEPLWRVLNCLRRKYWKDFGNTPGHINHWSPIKFVGLVGKYGRVVSVYRPIPWTIVHAEIRSNQRWRRGLRPRT